MELVATRRQLFALGFSALKIVEKKLRHATALKILLIKLPSNSNERTTANRFSGRRIQRLRVHVGRRGRSSWQRGVGHRCLPFGDPSVTLAEFLAIFRTTLKLCKTASVLAVVAD